MGERMVPHNVEAEQAVLGACLIDPAAVVEVRPIVKPQDFYVQKHEWVFETIVGLWGAGQAIDLVTLVNGLEERGILEEVGGAAYLTSLIVAVPTALHCREYATIVHEHASRRFLISCASDLAKAAYGEEPTAGAIAVAGRLMETAGGERHDLGDAVISLREQLAQWRANPLKAGEVRGLATGFRAVDAMLGGFDPSLVICGASTHVGKTAFACALAMNVAGRGEPVLFLTGEMAPRQLLARMACARSKVAWRRVKSGRLEGGEWDRLGGALEKIEAMPLEIVYSTDLSEAVSLAHRQKARGGLALLIVDFLGLYVDRLIDNRPLQLGSATRRLLNLSGDLQVPAFVLHQIGRATKGKRPGLHDYQWSGMIEQDCDLGCFLYREELNANNANGGPNPKGRLLEFSCLKNRLSGQLGRAMLYLGEFGEVGDLVEEDVPL